MPFRAPLSLVLTLVTAVTACAQSMPARKELLRQPATWYSSDDARTIADNIVAHQTKHGGWTNWSNEGGMMRPPTAADQSNLQAASLDDGATTTQLRILAQVITAPARPSLSPDRAARYRASFERGFDYVLAAQYPNGGWPHKFPATGYSAHITFNDDATYNVIVLLRAIAAREPAYAWLDAARLGRAKQAIDQGIACILACQVVQDGVKTAWGAQHDPKTLQPAAARKFEPASLCGHESVNLVRLLMTVDRPTPEIVAAVNAAVAWLQRVRITGLRTERFQTPEGYDTRVIADPNAPPLWARFYELGTNRPIFIGRDAIIKYELAQIERERRGGYGWYTERPRELLEKEYPAWAAKWSKR